MMPSQPSKSTPTARQPFHVMAKPIGPICNIDCQYCFYLEKEKLFPKTPSWRMNDEVLEAFVRQYIEAHPPGTPAINFAWQGGEPTLLGIDFFRRALELQRQYARPGVTIENALQTNGTLLDDAWGEFLAENDFLVGLSIDGPKELHDRYRVDKQGRPTFEPVMRGLEVLKKHGAPFNTLTVLNEANARHPVEVYDFLTGIGSTFLQFIPLVEKDEAGRAHPRSVVAVDYGRFLNGVFDRWIERGHIGDVFVQDFDVILSLVMGYPSPLCTRAETCGRAVAIEHNGNLYSCDHYVYPDHRIGSVLEGTMAAALDGAQQTQFGNDKRDTLPRYCRGCEYLGVCWGGCPRERIIETPDGEPGLNYLCEGFKIFYRHSLPVFEKMARCLRAGGVAGDWERVDEFEARHAMQQREAMQARAKQSQATMPSWGSEGERTVAKPLGKVKPNAPCPCGSGLKFKKCCGRKY